MLTGAAAFVLEEIGSARTPSSGCIFFFLVYFWVVVVLVGVCGLCGLGFLLFCVFWVCWVGCWLFGVGVFVGVVVVFVFGGQGGPTEGKKKKESGGPPTQAYCLPSVIRARTVANVRAGRKAISMHCENSCHTIGINRRRWSIFHQRSGAGPRLETREIFIASCSSTETAVTRIFDQRDRF